MSPTPPRAAWLIARLLTGHTLNGELNGLAEPWRSMADHLAGVTVDDSLTGQARREALAAARAPLGSAMIAAWSERDELTKALADVNPEGPCPDDGLHPTATEDGSADDWPPLRINEPLPTPSFPVDVFPPPLMAYCRETANTIQAPIDFVGGSMLAVAGAAVGQSVNVKIKRSWSEPPLLNVILVGRPGTAKSPVIAAVGKPLVEIDRRLRVESKAAQTEWESEKKAHERDPKNNPHAGPEPPQLRAVVKDITRESLAIVLRDNPRGVLVDPDEASGWVSSFNEYKGKGGSDRQFWLSVWNCKPVSVDRKGGRESVYVPHPFVAMLGGIPPAMLGSLAEERGRDDGFTDRCLFVYPDPSAFPSQRWTVAELSERAERDWSDAVGRLLAVPMVAEGETARPFYVSFTTDGEREWIAWFDSHADESRDPDFPDSLAGAWSKMKAHTARFALILSRLRLAGDPTADPETGRIDAQDVRGAMALASFFKAHLTRARHEMTDGIGSTDAKALLEWIKRKRMTTFREADAGEDLRRFRDNPRSLALAITALLAVDVIRVRPQVRTAGRIPSPAYDVHPEIHHAPGNTANTENGHAMAAGHSISGISGIFRRMEKPESNCREGLQ